jgi:hypothetical protein
MTVRIKVWDGIGMDGMRFHAWDLGFIEVLGLSLWLGNRVRVSVLGLEY